MNEAIVTTLITSGLTLIGIIVSSLTTIRKTETSIRINQAVTDTKITILTEEVKKHNNFAVRIPAVEEHLKSIDQDLMELKQAIKRVEQ